MGRRLTARDLRNVYRLIGEVRAAGRDACQWPLVAIDGLCKLLDAQAATCAVVNIPKSPSDLMVPEIHFCVGISEEKHQALVTMCLSGEAKENPLFTRLAARRERFVTVRRQDIVPDDQWYAAPSVEEQFFSYGLDHPLNSHFVALSIDKIVGCTILRKLGQPPFEVRHRRLLRLVHLELARMWQVELVVPDETSVRDLPLRQKQVLWMLCGGDSEKQIAAKLKLSKHTVHDYVKTLYKRFKASSRAELLIAVLGRQQQAFGQMAFPQTGYFKTTSNELAD